MSRLIKICGLTDPKNIIDILQLKPDWAGLIFYPRSPRFIADPERFIFINTIPDRPLTVAVFVNPDMEEVSRVTSILRIDIIQLHGSETPEFCQNLRECGYKVIKAFGLNHDFDFRQTDSYHGKADYFLFDTLSTNRGGTGEQFDWNLLRLYRGETFFMLSGGISPDTRIIPDHPCLLGVDLNSRFETSPGIKDIGLLKSFFKQFGNG